MRTFLTRFLLDGRGGLLNSCGLFSLLWSYSSHTAFARSRCSGVRTGGRGAPVATMNSAQRDPDDRLWGTASCSTMRLALLDWDIWRTSGRVKLAREMARGGRRDIDGDGSVSSSQSEERTYGGTVRTGVIVFEVRNVDVDDVDAAKMGAGGELLLLVDALDVAPLTDSGEQDISLLKCTDLRWTVINFWRHDCLM